MAQFGEILAELRKDHKMSQKELAKIIYVSTGTISNYETGTHFPDVEKLIALADHFHVTTDYLLGRCRQDCSPDIFDTLIAEGKTVGELIQEVQALPPERRQLLLALLEDMKLASVIRGYRREKP